MSDASIASVLAAAWFARRCLARWRRYDLLSFMQPKDGSRAAATWLRLRAKAARKRGER